ncbi:hypothetical protein [Enterococcus faecium]|uniref:hypothetical protein n=1 Tax=Enterococcus faecium TaxID=1352 RepID=UPI00032EE16F|nr:hypothetical protein [Enterococcus faecium]EOH43300.1 hypothetical protein SSG_02380 [Enterococcus faecium EnGen0190]
MLTRLTLGELLTLLGSYEFVTLFDKNNDVIVEDCLNDILLYDSLCYHLTALVTDIDTGISNSNGSLHAVIDITIDDIIEEEN